MSQDTCKALGTVPGTQQLYIMIITHQRSRAFPGGAVAKNPPANAGDTRDVGSIFPGQEDPLEQEMATHSNILVWKIPWTEESDGLQSMGLQTVRHD